MGDSTKTVAYEITADNTQFVQSMLSAGTAVTGMTDQVKKQFGGVAAAFEQIQKPLMTLAAVVGGGAFFKEAIGVTNKLNGEAMRLSKALGITGDQAATLRTALGDIYSDGDTYVGAFQKFAKTLKTNEEGMQAMGLKTRDANGNLRDSNTLFTEALGVVGSYKPGLDQTTAAMTLFGKGVDDVMALQKLNNQVLDDAAEKNELLGMTLTKEGVEASKQYKAAMNDVGDVLEAVKNAVGQAVMPVFTELGNYFAQTGPYVVAVFKGALTGLLATFRVVQGAVQVVAGVVFEAFSTIIDGAGLLGDVFSKLFAGDFGGAAESAKALGSRVGQGFKNAFMNFVDVGNEVEGKVKSDFDRVWGKGTAVGAPKGGTNTMGDFGKTNEKKNTPSAMPGMEAELEALRLATTRKGLIEGQYREVSKADEAKFWRDKAAMAGLSVEDRAKAAKKASEAELAVIKQGFELKVATLQAEEAAYKNNMDAKIAIQQKIQGMYAEGTKEYEQAQAKIDGLQRQAAEQAKQVEQVKLDAKREALLAGITLEEQQVQQELQLGVISQQQALEMQRQFEERRYQVSHEALVAKLTEQEKDPDKNPVELARIHSEIEALEQQHQQKLGALRGAAQEDKLAPVTNIFRASQDAFGTAIQGMLMKSQNLNQSMRNIYKSMASAVTGEIGKMIAAKVAMFAKEKILAALGIQTNAATAASGAAASQAAIPVVGPAMGVAAAAAIMAAVLGFSSMLPSASAEGGFDIPGTMSPIVQTHPREMILPAKHADVIRAMADGGGGMGGDTHSWHINALSPREFEGFLRNGGADKVVDALMERKRNGRY
jgi:hypothetical protein